jgi:hypothetical protein
MIQQPQTRQPDETLCFRCNTIVKRDAESCPNCGSRIAAGPKHTAAEPLLIKGRPGRASAPPTPAAPPEEVGATSDATAYAAEDVVGAGRYILNFILAGFVGLGLTYLMRRQGWLATYICIPIAIIATFLIFAVR